MAAEAALAESQRRPDLAGKAPESLDLVPATLVVYEVWYRRPMKLAVTVAMALFAFAALLAGIAAKPPAASTSAAKPSERQTEQTPNPSASTQKRKIPCKTQENASLCYWTHGRLMIANGNPSLRIWRIGTHRMLGIFSGPSHYPPRTIADDEDPELPPELDRAYAADNRARKKATGTMWALPPPTFADFEVCPLKPVPKGWMQPVCIESAKKIFIDNDY